MELTSTVYFRNRKRVNRKIIETRYKFTGGNKQLSEYQYF